MKKNISINISGIIFHIEEDGYDTLKRYLDSINTYFSSYEDSEEIIADIEGRIAEIFLAKLTDGNQVVSALDVSDLIKTMGNIADFEAIEEEGDFEAASSDKASTEEDSKAKEDDPKSSFDKNASGTYVRPDKLYRDLNRKVLGGVAAGIGHYYNVDPLWIRVALLLFIFSGGFIILAPFSGIAFIAYFIMWAITPGREDLVEDKKLKKLYRDPDNSVLGGVASGLSKYFDIDPLVVRILFIVAFFGFGTGFLAYVILWIITPEASSITDKMQMEGQPVTLSNIESKVKKDKEEELVEKGEGAFTTVLLFPFRLVGKVFSGLSKALAPLMLFLVSIIRVFTGSIIAIVGISVMFAMLVTAGVFLGIYSDGADWYRWGDWGYLPYEIVHDTVPGIGIAFLLIAIFIPFLYVFIAGITIIAKRKIMSSSVGWSILGIWLIAIVGTTATLPNVVRDFRDEGVYRDSEILAVTGDTIVLNINTDYRSNRNDRFYRDFSTNDFDLIDLDIRMSSNDEFKLDKRIYSRGRTVRDAELNAQMINYDLNIREGSIEFDTHYTFDRNGKFRAQELDMTLYIPKNQPFQIKRGMRDIMRYFSRRYDWWEIYRNTWVFTDNGLECLSCEDDEPVSYNRNSNDYLRQMDLDFFDDVEINNDFDVSIIAGDDHEISIQGPEYKVRDVDVNVIGGQLEIDYDGELDRDEIFVTITTPQFKSLDVQDETSVDVSGFNDIDLTVKTYDDSSINLDGNLNQLSLYLTDDSRFTLSGNVEDLRASLIENSRLYAFDAEAISAEVGTNAESRARVNVSDYLKAVAKGFSSIRYKGNPKLDVIDRGRSANISAY